MLTKKQLEDAARCGEIQCEECSMYEDGAESSDCSAKPAQIALAYREMLEQLEWVRVGEREEQNKMIPAILCPSCGKWKEEGHKPDCELAKMLEVEK